MFLGYGDERPKSFPREGWICGRALAVRSNVAIDTFTCSSGDEVDQAVRGLNEIAAKIDG